MFPENIKLSTYDSTCIRHSLPSTFNIGRDYPSHEQISTNSNSIRAWNNNQSPAYGLLGSRTCRDHVSCVKSITAGHDFFFQRNKGKVFFNNKVFIVIMQKLYRVRITQRSSHVRTALEIFLENQYSSQIRDLSTSSNLKLC